MKQLFNVWLLLAAAPLAGAQTPAPSPATPAAASAPSAPSTPAAATPDQTSYLFGLSFGEQMHRVGITDQLSVDAITRGLKDGLQGRKTTPAEQQQLANPAVGSDKPGAKGR